MLKGSYLLRAKRGCNVCVAMLNLDLNFLYLSLRDIVEIVYNSCSHFLNVVLTSPYIFDDVSEHLNLFTIIFGQ